MLSQELRVCDKRPATEAWPAVDVQLRICAPCLSQIELLGQVRGRGLAQRPVGIGIRGEPKDADAVVARLARLTGRPWRWERLHDFDGRTFETLEDR